MDRQGQKWSREETILAFDLYCRTPFSKISQTNPEVIALAKLLGRSPGSVGLKMHNLAHYDPELQKRNVVAMAHGSKLDKEIWDEFNENCEELAFVATKLLAEHRNERIDRMIDLGDMEYIPEGKERDQIVKSRIGQYYFRLSVLNSYENKCCVTGIDIPELLIASHIKPWRTCSSKERTNPTNGLSLNAFHDKAFDCGLITVDKNFVIYVSNKIKKNNLQDKSKEWLMHYNGEKILLPSKFYPSKECLEYHNDVIFQH